MKQQGGRHHAPTQAFTWRGWHIEIAALDGPVYQIDAASPKDAAGAYAWLRFCVTKSLPPAAIASGIMYRLRQNWPAETRKEPTMTGPNESFVTLEAIEYVPPRLRVLMVGHPANAIVVNRAAAELEAFGFHVHAYQFETWADGDGDVRGACCWS